VICLSKGDLSISSTFSSGDNTISVEGTWTNSDGFTAGTGEVRFLGTGDQTISPMLQVRPFTTFLSRKRAVSLSLANNVIVSNTLLAGTQGTV
jgi:hypothetical protein